MTMNMENRLKIQPSNEVHKMQTSFMNQMFLITITLSALFLREDVMMIMLANRFAHEILM
jgi:uncharacterized membrane protein YozB (DUF420 family)